MFKCTVAATADVSYEEVIWHPVHVAQAKKQPAVKQQIENTKPPAGKPVVPKLPLPAFADVEDLHGFTAPRELMRL